MKYDEFVAHVRVQIDGVLSDCKPLKDAIENLLSASHPARSDLVDKLKGAQRLETVISEYLRPATVSCLKNLDCAGRDFKKRWDAAREVLAWLCVLSVRDGWQIVTKITGKQGSDCFFEIPVKTELGVEILCSHYHRRRVAFPENPPMKSDIPGRDRFSAELPGGSFEPNVAVDEFIRLNIWRQVFPREESKDRLSNMEIERLDDELEERSKYNETEHHYLSFSPMQSTPLKNDEFLCRLLGKLPHLRVFRMGDGSCPLLVATESKMLAAITGFLKLPEYLRKRP